MFEKTNFAKKKNIFFNYKYFKRCKHLQLFYKSNIFYETYYHLKFIKKRESYC